jgi:hypothetical protein
LSCDFDLRLEQDPPRGAAGGRAISKNAGDSPAFKFNR